MSYCRRTGTSRRHTACTVRRCRHCAASRAAPRSITAVRLTGAPAVVGSLVNPTYCRSSAGTRTKEQGSHT
eukprot:12637743-Heterocapsa_arctica.AAC.1